VPSRKRIDGVSSRVWLIHARGGALPSKGNTIWFVLFYGVVSAQTEKVVEFFLEREAAEAMIGEVREDEPLLAEELRVEASNSAMCRSTCLLPDPPSVTTRGLGEVSILSSWTA